MKKNILTLFPVLLFGLLSTLNLFAQAPDAMIYQAEARDDKGHLIGNKTVDVRLAIQEGSIGGPEVWINNYTVTTDNYGLFTITLGDPTNANDDLYDIEWELHPFFLDVQVLYKGIWINVGTTQFLSVPYALHAKTATNALSASYEGIEGAPTDLSEFTNFAGYITNAMEQDPVFNAWNKSTGISITESQISDLAHFTNSDETDPIFNVWDKSTGINISEDQISDLVHFTNTDETDPLFTAAPASSISDDNIANWIAAYDWGNHSEAGYLTSELDADPTNELQDLSDLALKSDVLELDNTTVFTPNADYEPATKKYVDDNTGGGSGIRYIGEELMGGIIFYITPDGQHGLIAESQDQGAISWYEAISLILNTSNHSSAGKNYTDWRLPTKYELNLIYLQKVMLAVSGVAYWSSTEYISVDANKSCFQYFNHSYYNNGEQSYANKVVGYNVRAIRAF